MPSTVDYAEKKIAEYLAGVSANLSHLPEAERSRRLRNAESEIAANSVSGILRRRPNGMWMSFSPAFHRLHAMPSQKEPAPLNMLRQTVRLLP